MYNELILWHTAALVPVYIFILNRTDAFRDPEDWSLVVHMNVE